MKGYRFYEDFASNVNKRKRISSGNVVAVVLWTKESCDVAQERSR